MNNPFRKARLVVSEMIDELRKASWPTGAELRGSTVVVILAAVVLGVFTSISDFALFEVVDWLTSLSS